MNIDDTISNLTSIPVNDRLRVIGAIWDSIPNQSVPSPSPAQQAELERRIAAHDRDPSTAIPLEELNRRLDKRK